MTRRIARYGWLPDLPDQRDHVYAAPPAILGEMPAKVDLSTDCPPVYDQGQLGSCTGNGIAAALQFDAMKQKLPDQSTPSRLFIYYNERALEGTVNQDAGAQIRDGIKTVNSDGACPETEWPYNVEAFATKPPDSCYADAAKFRAIGYSRVARTLPQMKGCLAAGYPIVFGFTVYESFESGQVATTGEVPMPGAGEQVLGGHCVVAVGYDDSTSQFLIRNSWGPGWGQKGYATMPYAYLLSPGLSSDFWTIRTVSAATQ
ncbi:C1 family peptidase [Rhodococcus spelaei]|uniref:C1 family peptidase n=1 Tax=Rhodococcus spelaei TaxID=2546320 RepID=A0A541BMS4_9NOCA|nr:C1 family peptidase [Rhodococcus spelaei]TQF73632.1 C1 family peptidase [Rhodococcus spelaei]